MNKQMDVRLFQGEVSYTVDNPKSGYPVGQWNMLLDAEHGEWVPQGDGCWALIRGGVILDWRRDE